MKNEHGIFNKGKERFVKGFKYFYNHKEKSYFEFLDPRVGFHSARAIFDILAGTVLMVVGIPMKAFGA